MGRISTVRTSPCPRWRSRHPRPANLSAVAVTGLFVARVLFSGQPPSLPPTGVPVPVTRVIDGDTLLIDGGYRVRLLGVNTPETKHPNRPPEPWGPEAHQLTQSLVSNKSIVLELDRERWDDYRRTLAYAFLDDQSLLNEQLISEGLSPAVVTFPIRSDRRRLFLKAEAEARQKRINLWSSPALE